MNYNIWCTDKSTKCRLTRRDSPSVTHSLGLVEADLLRLYAQVLEYLIEGLAVMAEGYRAVMRIVLLHQHMAVEASHLRNREDADGSKGPGRYRKHLALGHIGAQPAVCRALQTKKVMSPGTMSPSRVPCVTSSGRLLAMMS